MMDTVVADPWSNGYDVALKLIGMVKQYAIRKPWEERVTVRTFRNRDITS